MLTLLLILTILILMPIVGITYLSNRKVTLHEVKISLLVMLFLIILVALVSYIEIKLVYYA